MADQEIGHSPLEKEVARSFGITPEDVRVSAELGTSPEDVLEERSIRWRSKQRQIDKTEAEAAESRSEALAEDVGLDRRFERIITRHRAARRSTE